MLVNTNITEKTYRKLAIQVSLNGFSFAVFDTLHAMVDSVGVVNFAEFPVSNSIEENFKSAFREKLALNDKYDTVVVVHDNNLSTFVPKALFNEAFLGSYLQYNAKVFETDFFTFDTIDNYEMNTIYIPYANINNFLIDQFGTFDYRHTSSVLVEKLLDLSKNIDEPQVFVHFDTQKLELIVVKNQQLLFFNSFEYKTEQDFIYFLLFTAEQLNLNPEHFKLFLLGAINEESSYFEMAYQYVRNVSLLDVSGLMKHNNFSISQNLQHFILFQS